MMIAEVSNKFDISADTLRYYERIGLIPPVNRNTNGVRDYTEEDCEWVYFIKCMRAAGLSIEILIEYVRGYTSIKTLEDVNRVTSEWLLEELN